MMEQRRQQWDNGGGTIIMAKEQEVISWGLMLEGCIFK